ncbi:MAG: hypothetical protein Q9227_007471 [Pyrenula ochraceoflavens]
MTSFTIKSLLATFLATQVQSAAIGSAPIPGYGVEPFTWTVTPAAGAEAIVVSGTVQDVYAAASKINPNFAVERNATAATAHRRDLSEASTAIVKRDRVNCNLGHNWGNADKAAISDGITYLRGVGGKPTNGPGPGNCGRSLLIPLIPMEGLYCQKCRSPLKIDGSVSNLNPAAFDLLVGPDEKLQYTAKESSSINYPRERKELYDAQKPGPPTYKRSIPHPRHGFSNHVSPMAQSQSRQDMSFVMLTESQVAPDRQSGSVVQLPGALSPVGRGKPEGKMNGQAETAEQKSFSSEIEKAARLYSIISAHSDIDHPICAECTDLVVESMNQKVQEATKQRDAYSSFLRQLKSSLPSDEDLQAAQTTLDRAKKLEASVREELLALEAEKENVMASIGELEDEARELDAEEEEFWKSRNAFSETLHDLTTTRDALSNKLAHDSQRLERLRRTNVYNDTFCIGHDNFFGTINGLRLGRLPNHPVEWSEINAAWGLTLLLIVTVAEKIGYAFQGYRLKPMGSNSRIEKLEYTQQGQTNQKTNSRQNSARKDSRQSRSADPNPPLPPTKVTPLDLFSSGDMALGRIFSHGRFDAGMVAFLDCLSQLGRHVAYSTRNSSSGQVTLPYSINGDKIGEVSIKLGAGFQQDESWTKACKFTLTCCKFLLAYASNQSPSVDKERERERDKGKREK